MSSEQKGDLVITSSPQPVERCHKRLRRALRRQGFKIAAESRLSLYQENARRQAAACTILVAWSPFFAYQTMQLNCDPGLLLPFCLVLREDERSGWTQVSSPDYGQSNPDADRVGARMLARVLELQIRQAIFAAVDCGTYRYVVEQGGGEYRGIQPGSAAGQVPDLVLFDDPATHTTLALAVGEGPITAGAVRRKIAASRSQFRVHEECSAY